MEILWFYIIPALTLIICVFVILPLFTKMDYAIQGCTDCMYKGNRIKCFIKCVFKRAFSMNRCDITETPATRQDRFYKGRIC